MRYNIQISRGIAALLERFRTKEPRAFQRIAVYVGDASYSIYLTHLILIVALISSIAGCIAYSVIEKPLLKRIPRGWPSGARGIALPCRVRGA
jgi:peptidoglycan/LPS O-acetylase OafA/YrhL